MRWNIGAIVSIFSRNSRKNMRIVMDIAIPSLRFEKNTFDLLSFLYMILDIRRSGKLEERIMSLKPVEVYIISNLPSVTDKLWADANISHLLRHALAIQGLCSIENDYNTKLVVPPNNLGICHKSVVGPNLLKFFQQGGKCFIFTQTRGAIRGTSTLSYQLYEVKFGPGNMPIVNLISIPPRVTGQTKRNRQQVLVSA